MDLWEKIYDLEIVKNENWVYKIMNRCVIARINMQDEIISWLPKEVYEKMTNKYEYVIENDGCLYRKYIE